MADAPLRPNVLRQAAFVADGWYAYRDTDDAQKISSMVRRWLNDLYTVVNEERIRQGLKNTEDIHRGD